MGRGIALQFKKAFPQNFTAYKAACESGEVVPGKMFVTEPRELSSPKFIVNFPTKRHWRGNSRIEDIESGLVALRHEIVSRRIGSIAIPPLGSGLGGLVWHEVRERIESALSDIEVEIDVFEPSEPSTIPKNNATSKIPNMTPGRATLVVLLHRYLSGLLDPFVTLIELHKLMYFMQEAGEPLKLKFVKHYYGPYAENLRHVLNHIEGHMISGYADGGDTPHKQLSLVTHAVTDAENLLQKSEATLEKFERVSTLVDGFESPSGLELLATVHWLAKHEGVESPPSIVKRTHEWNDGKKRFSPRQIELAFQHLSKNGWL